MNYEAWQMKRKTLMDKEQAERSTNFAQARPHIQTAITEQAVRELFDRVEALEQRSNSGGKQRA